MAHGSIGPRGAMTSFAVENAVSRLRDQLRDAAERGVPVRIRGAGTWMDAGRPVNAVETLSTSDHAGIVSYVPGDLTMTVRAGTTLAEIRDATAAHNQWLALDPHGVDEGTIGATTVTASAGPLATFFGTPRDLVLGVEFISGTGAVARGGGRVVKNVAGFDLTRLIIGSWGTIGVVTEVTVRLHARPEADRSLAIAIGDNDVGKVRALLRRATFKPYACEIVNARLASALGIGNALTVLLRLAGNAEGIAAQHELFGELGASSEIANDVWTKLRAIDTNELPVIRLSNLPSEIDAIWRVADVANALVHASPARGIVRVIGGDVVPLTTEKTHARIGERLPANLWTSFPIPTQLNARVKRMFDPSAVLNRGILGDAS